MIQQVAPQQLPLIPDAKIVSQPVSLERIYALTSVHDALNYACELARVVPKQIYSRIGKDKTVWSRITNGEIDLPSSDIPKINRLLGNNAITLYLNHQDGIDLTSMRKAQDDKDRRIEELERELAEERQKNRVISEFVGGILK